MMRASSLSLLALAAALAACAHAPLPPAQIQADPMVVNGPDAIDRLLATMNDEELFTKGSSAYAAGNYDLAARAFDRLCNNFPKSPHFGAATYNSGLAHEQLAAAAKDEAANVQWQAAIDHYRPLLDIEHGTGDQIDAAFRTAECLYHLEKYDDAIALLKRIQARADLSKNVQLEAETQIGICQVEAGDFSDGEITLRDVMRRFEAADASERLDDYYPAQAQFYLGEIYRSYFEQVVLDPNKPPENPDELCPKAQNPKPGEDPCDPGLEQLAKDLEYKAEMLLSAQGHYLRAIRIGNAQWATASGERVGQLYETMYDAMTQAPAPKDLDAEQTEVYRQELRKKVRVLVTKAINIYESTIDAAERTGTEGGFVQQARASLERMKAVLLADAKAEDADAPPPPKEDPAAQKNPSSARNAGPPVPVARR